MIKTAKNTKAELKLALKVLMQNIIFTEENKIRAVIRHSIYFKFIRKNFDVGAMAYFLFNFTRA